MYPLHLSADDVHVWCVSLDRASQNLSKLKSLLSPDEIVRAYRFHFEKDRNYFIISHGFLRSILGEYLGIEPSHVKYCYGSYGKPMVDIVYQDKILQFSFSHSHNLALCAITWDKLIGVDIEYIRPIPESVCIAEQFFLPNENAVIGSLPFGQRQDAFFRFWTCKEAYLKAIGYGMTKPLSDPEISMLPGDLVQLVSVHGSRCEADLWQMETLLPFPGYLAALAVQGHGWQIKLVQLNGYDQF